MDFGILRTAFIIIATAIISLSLLLSDYETRTLLFWVFENETTVSCAWTIDSHRSSELRTYLRTTDHRLYAFYHIDFIQTLLQCSAWMSAISIFLFLHYESIFIEIVAFVFLV